MRRQHALAALLLLLISGAVQAHLLKLFAYVEGQRIHGSVYFAGGSSAVGARVQISSATGEPVARLNTDDRGAFSFPLDAPGEYLLEADSSDGHRAQWRIQRSEFGNSSRKQAPDDRPFSEKEPPPPAAEERLAEMLEQAVARQIGPLRQQLQRQYDRARFSDIIGGIGFIFGIAGLLMWWRSRQRGDR